MDLNELIKTYGWKRNPFTKGGIFTSSGNASLYLTGIMWDEKKPQAIVGDEVVKEGDMIENYRIVKINKDNVIISGDKGEKTLKIWEE